MLAVGQNGSALRADHGYPVRMVVPGLYGYVSATKWVTEIELTTWDAFDAYWVPRGWAKEAPVKTATRIDRPRHNGETEAGPYEIGGVAWAVHRGISGVQVRIDGGEWLDGELAGVPSDDTWRQELPWVPARKHSSRHARSTVQERPESDPWHPAPNAPRVPPDPRDVG